MRALMHFHIICCAVVSQSMASTKDLAFAFAPFLSTQVAEVIAAQTCDMVAARLLLNHMSTFETSHPIVGQAKSGDRIFAFGGDILILSASHASMPLRFATIAQSLLAFRATTWAIHIHFVLSQLVQCDESTTIGLWTIHHV